MEGAADYAANLFSDPDLGQNDSLSFNTTAANTSSVYTAIISPVMDKTINILLIIAVFITMVSLGCTMEVSKIKVTSETLGSYIIIGLMYIMLRIETVLMIIFTLKHLSPSLQRHIVKPKGVAIAVLAQYGVMPLTAFCLAKVGIAA